MKILVVSDTPSHPTLAGNSACIVGYCDLLAQIGHEVEFLYVHTPWGKHANSITPTREAWGARFHLLEQTSRDRLCQSIHHRFLFGRRGGYGLDSLCPGRLPATVRRIVKAGGHQAVVLNYWHLSRIFVGLEGVRKLVYTHDVFGDRFARTTSRWLSTTPQIEGKAFSRADAILAIQEDEARYFRGISDTPVYTTFSHFPVVDLPAAGTRDLLFLSGPNRINADGIRHFAREILPALRQVEPRIRLLVAGRICSVVQDLSEIPGVVLQGEVDSPAAFYAQGDIALNPVDRGSGLKIKTFEAMAHGRVAVVHPHCAIGIHAPLAAPLRLATSAAEHVAAIVPLLASEQALTQARDETFRYIRALDQHVLDSFRCALEGLSPP